MGAVPMPPPEPPATAPFDDFFSTNYARVLLFAEIRLGDRSAAEDIAEEAFRIAWQKLGQGQELSLAWILVVARNLVGNEYRRQRRHPAATAVDVVDAGKADEEFRHLEVRAAVRNLQPAERELVYLVYWEDLPTGVVATMLGCSVPTLWVRLHRVRTKLRTVLGTEDMNVSEEVREDG